MTLVTYPGALEYILGPTTVYTGTTYDVLHRNEALHWANAIMAESVGNSAQINQGFQYGIPAIFLREFYRGGPTVFQSAARKALEWYRDGTGDFPDNAFNTTMIQGYLNADGTNSNNFFNGYQEPSPQMFSAYVLNHPAGEAAAARKCRDIVRLGGAKHFYFYNMKVHFNQWGHPVRETGSVLNWNWHAILLGDGDTPVTMNDPPVVQRTPNQMLERTIVNLMEHDATRNGWFYDFEPSTNERYVGNMNLCGTTLEALCNVDRWKREVLGVVDSRLTHLISRAISWLDTQWVPIGQNEPGGEPGFIHYGGSWRYYWYEFDNYGNNGTFPATLYWLGGHLKGPYAYKYLRDGQQKDKQRVFDAMDGDNLELARRGGTPMFDSRHYTEYARTFHQGLAWVEIKDGGALPPDDPPPGTITLTGPASVQGGVGRTATLTATVTEANYIACRFTLVAGPGITQPSPMDPEIFGTGLPPNPYVFNWNINPQFTPPGTYQITATARRASDSTPPPVSEFEGFGAATTGAAGKPTLFVTNLSDTLEGNPTINGTLRWAVETTVAAGGNRRIVLNTAGTIDLLDASVFLQNVSNVTLEATAPVTIENFGINVFYSSNVILKNLRVRRPVGELDYIGFYQSHDCVVDHCSVIGAAFSEPVIGELGDGGVDVKGGSYNITVQNTLLGVAKQALVGSSDSDEDKHTRNVTYHRNAFISVVDTGGVFELNAGYSDRSPLARRAIGSLTTTLIDFRNNIVAYAFHANATKIGNNARANIVGNAYIPAPATTVNDREDCIKLDDNLGDPPLAFTAGNVELGTAPVLAHNINTNGNQGSAFAAPALSAVTLLHVFNTVGPEFPRDADEQARLDSIASFSPFT